MKGRWMVEGAVGGSIGAGILAVWFLLYDMAEGQPLRTPALLGAALLHGLRDAGALQITLRLVVEYSLVHSAAFLVFGCAVAGLLFAADRAPELIFALLLLFCCFEVFVLVLVTILAEWLFEALAWWAIVLGNLAASAGMLAFFWRRHLRAWRVFISAAR
jgi:hypothetical protein